jgi:hypothetical protein
MPSPLKHIIVSKLGQIRSLVERKKGLVKPAYQETITGWVTLLERNPTATDSTILEIIASISFDF